MEKKVIFLFDLDGVLVKPGGYRAASKDTLQYFTQKMGIKVNFPGEDGLAHFEASSITNEWDMVPLSLALIMDTALSCCSLKITANSLNECISLIKKNGITEIEVDYHGYIQKLKPFLSLHVIPSDALLIAYRQGNTRRLFKKIPEGVLQDLLGQSRDVKSSATTRIFQHFILGSSTFERTYGLKAEFQTPSYLKTLDQPLLSEKMQQTLINGMREKHLYCAGMTARPSAPPVEDKNGSAIYSPEAEIACELINMSEMPVIGYGEMSWLAQRVGMAPNDLLKPAAPHAIAALYASLGMDVLCVLKQLESELCENRAFSLPFLTKNAGIELDVHVFEDSPNGILSCDAAMKELNNAYTIRLYKHGITTHPIKRNALEALGAVVDEDINQALLRALDL